MISAGVAVEGHGHGLGLPGPGPGPGGPYLPSYPPTLPPSAPTHVDWRHKQEFLRPAPKHATSANARFNGSSAHLNGTRLLKYSTPTNPSSLPSLSSLAPPNLPSSLSLTAPSLPVNLSAHSQHSQQQIKDEPHTPTHTSTADDLPTYYPRLYPPPGAFGGLYPGPYAGLYSGPYGQMVRVATAAASVGYVAPPTLSPLEPQYSPPASATSPHAPAGPSQSQTQGTFVTPAAQFPSNRKELVREQRERERERIRDRETEKEKKVVQGFKVPSGKEGSLKHRILPRLDPPRVSKPHLSLSKHHSPNNNNNTVVPGNFSKGSLIELATGELRRVEDMKTEDFVLSAERSPELRLAESTVVRVCEKGDTVMITLTYNQNRTQVEFEATVEHPFFVYGQGWASCSPDRTLQHYGLKVHRLQVGDILVSLTPREPAIHAHSTGVTYDLSKHRDTVTVTTATTTAMTARQVTRPSVSTAPAAIGVMPPPSSTTSTSNASANSFMDSSSSSRKRRWSAPDQITDEHEQNARRVKE